MDERKNRKGGSALAKEEIISRYHGKYAGIIACDRPRHEADDFSVRHPAMAVSHRAKLFKPFAALAGFEEAIAEKNIVYIKRGEYSELRREKINRALAALFPACRTQHDCRLHQVRVQVTCFCQVTLPFEDARNDGESVYGFYETVSGVVEQIDLIGRTLHLRTSSGKEKREIAFQDMETLQRCRE